MRLSRVLLLALLVAPLAVKPAAAEQASVLGANGTVYTVQTGTYRTLFPALATDSNADYPVLALDTLHPGEAAVRQLVPETGGPETETLPYLVVDDAGSLFLIWMMHYNVSSVLFVTSLQGDTWGDVFPVLGNFFNGKLAPQLAVTRDTVVVATDTGTTRRSTRTVLHLVWWEDSGVSGRVIYAPLILIDGVYHEQDQTSIVLTDFDAAVDTPDARVSLALYQSPRIVRGQSDQSVVIGFANTANGHLATVEATVLPSDLAVLVDSVRAHIITGGKLWQGNLSAIGDAVRAHIITGGRGGRLNSRVLGFLGDAVRAHIITGGLSASNLTALANDARDFLLRSGAGLQQSGLVAPDTAGTALVEQPAPADAQLPEQLLQVRLVTSRPAPLTGTGVNSIFLSDDATRALVAWEANATDILYSESTDSGWSDPLKLTVSKTLTRDAAYHLLDQRLRGH